MKQRLPPLLGPTETYCSGSVDTENERNAFQSLHPSPQLWSDTLSGLAWKSLPMMKEASNTQEGDSKSEKHAGISTWFKEAAAEIAKLNYVLQGLFLH